MRWTTLGLIVILLHIRTAGRSQITLHEKDAPLETILSAIEKQSRYVFLYDPDIIRIGLITIDIKNATIREALEKIFKDLPIEFTIVGNNVLLKRKKTLKIYDHAIPGRETLPRKRHSDESALSGDHRQKLTTSANASARLKSGAY
jgi:hypothetical protein